MKILDAKLEKERGPKTYFMGRPVDEAIKILEAPGGCRRLIR